METKQKRKISREQVMTGYEYITLRRTVEGARELLSYSIEDSFNPEDLNPGITDVLSILDAAMLIMGRTAEWTTEILDGRATINNESAIAEMEL